MGGSSLWFTCISIGIILSVARNVEQQEGSQLKNLEAAVAAESESKETETKNS